MNRRARGVTLTDMLTEEVVSAYQALGLLRVEDGGAGFGLTEASVTIIIERRGDAIARGATILGSVLGTGSASDCTVDATAANDTDTVRT